MSDRGGLSDDEPSALPSRNPTNQFSIPTSPQRDSQPSIQSRSALARNNSFESSARAYREDLPTSRPKIGRPATDTNLSQPGRIQVRTPTKVGGRGDKTYDGYDSPDRSSSPDQPFTERSTSPATSYGSGPSRMIALVSSDAANASQLRKGPAPPPPPSRSKKPPPPPPAKRSALSASEVARS